MQLGLMDKIGEYFPLILLILIFSSGVVGLIDLLFLKKARKNYFLNNLNPSEKIAFEKLDKAQKLEKLKAPWLIDYSKHLFPVFVLVFILRSFVGEFYEIPSGSMLPDYLIGDYLYVNKYIYGVRLPIWDKKIIAVGEPQRGDVIVFHYPADPSVDFIKRVVGIPGDHISYINKKLIINGQPVPMKFLGYQMVDGVDADQAVQVYQEDLNHHVHGVIAMPWRSGGVMANFKDLIIPPGKYFVMGDNRDDSEDSRYWGFVDESQLVGKAEMVMLSVGDHGVRWGRIGHWLS